MYDKRTRRRATKSTGASKVRVRPEDAIFSAIGSAGEFYKLSTSIPALVDGVSRSLWLRRTFGEWLDDFCARFAWSSEVVEKMSVCIELAWYGALYNSERRAPGWLIGWPKEVERETILAAPERLDAPSTWKIEKEILARVKQAWSRLSKYETESGGERRVETLDIFQQTMTSNPHMSYREICGAIDDECDREGMPSPLPPKFREHGHTALLESIDCTDCRDYAKVLLSTKRKPLHLPRPPKSLFLRKPKKQS